jgi:hypothetical protein
MEKRNCMAGLVMLGFATFGGWYITRALLLAISSGASPGKLGAIHHAGSVNYFIFIVACFIGIALTVAVGVLGFRWTGLGKSDK